MKKVLICLVLFGFSFLFAEEQKPVLEPNAALRELEVREQTLEKWAKVNVEPGTDQFRKKDADVRKVVDEIVDYRFIAEFIIGAKWASTPDSQREELFNKIKELFSKVYLGKLVYNKGYEKKYLDKGSEKNYLKGVPESVFIVSEITASPKNKPVTYELIYHMRSVDGAYKIFDIELDTVSLSMNYREQFNKNLKTQSVDKLIKLIDKKIKGSTSSENTKSQPKTQTGEQPENPKK